MVIYDRFMGMEICMDFYGWTMIDLGIILKIQPRFMMDMCHPKLRIYEDF